ncbi:tetratricopeptide repeat protein [Desulfosarcina sp. OttesenSCG-928-A07]|nr:tetratricopeptide repeat protein [Desulfosarcina sp. OttesenSCG-928-G17]MDL2329606.1 tetratricopeptide repeat protein [Desulfosarcina sp. OttesenSCG-928-A07]
MGIRLIGMAFIGILILGACTLIHSEPVMPYQDVVEVASPANSYYFFSQSHLYLKEKNFDQAIEAIQKAIDLDPDSSFLKQELAEILIVKQDFFAATKILEEVVRADPNNAEAMILLGRIYNAVDTPDQAIEMFSRAVDIDPDQEDVYLMLCGLYMEEEEWEAVRDICQKWVNRFPESYAGYFYLGRASAMVGDTASAKIYFEKVLSLEPRLLEARFELGSVYESDRQYKAAIQIYKDILALHPDHLHAMMALGHAFYCQGWKRPAYIQFSELGKQSLFDEDVARTLATVYLGNEKYEASLVILAGMRRAAPKNPTLLYLTGVAMDGLGKKKEAIHWLTQVPLDSPLYQNAILHSAILYQELNLPGNAISLVRQAIKDMPGETEFWFYLASFYEQAEAYKQAEQALFGGLRLDPDNPMLYFRLGVIYDKWGRKDESIICMNQVIEMDPDNAEALNYLGYTYAEQGVFLDKAESLIRKALALKPGDGYITDSLGWVYYQRGEYESASLFLETAVRLVPDDPVVWEHLGDVYKKLGRNADAYESYQEAIASGHTNTALIKLKISELDAP